LYASAVLDQKTNEIILKLVNTTDKEIYKDIRLNVKKRISPKARLTVLKSDSPEAVNSLEQPRLVYPSEEELSVKGKSFQAVLAASSFSVYRLKLTK
jgi:alpha-L-arabinofuranosidase